MKEILKGLADQRTFYNWLKFIRDTDGLELMQDNNWYWLEYKGNKIECSGRERFTRSSEMADLLHLAGL